MIDTLALCERKLNFSTSLASPFHARSRKQVFLNFRVIHLIFLNYDNDKLTVPVPLGPFQTKVGGANHGGGSFEEVLSSTAHASAQSSAGGPRLAEGEELQC